MPGIPRRGGASHGSTVAQGVISVVMELKQLQHQLSEVESLMKRRMSSAGNNAGRAMGRSVSTGLGTMLGGPILGIITNLGYRIGETLSAGITSALANGVIIAGLGIELQGEMQDAEVVMQTLIGSMAEGSQLFQDLKKFAIETPFPFQDLIGAAKKLSIKMPADQVMKSIKMLGDVASGTGVDLERLAFTYEKVYGSARVMNYSLRQFERAGLPIYDTIGKNKGGKSYDEIFKMATKGQITGDDVVQAFEDMTGAAGKFYKLTERRSNLQKGQLEKLNDSLKEIARSIGEVLQPAVELFTQTALAGLPAIKKLLMEFYELLTPQKITTWGAVLALILDGLWYGFNKLYLMVRQFNAELAAAPYHALKALESVSRLGGPLGWKIANELKKEAAAKGQAAASAYPEFYSMGKDGTLGNLDPTVNSGTPVSSWLAKALAEGNKAVAENKASEDARAEKELEAEANREEARIRKKYGYGSAPTIDAITHGIGSIPGALASMLKGVGMGGLVGVMKAASGSGIDLESLRKKKDKVLEGGFSSFEDLNRNIQNTLLKETVQKKIEKNTAHTNKLLTDIPGKIGESVARNSFLSVFIP